MKHWAITRNTRRFSSIHIHYAHKQVNKRVKGFGGAIGITKNPLLLEFWILIGPKVSRVVMQFVGLRDANKIMNDLCRHEE